MAKLAVKDSQIRALKPKTNRYDRGFGGGFSIRVYPDGRKVARCRYQIGGVVHVLTLGEYGRNRGQFPLTEILDRYTMAKAAIARGENPAAWREQVKEEARAFKQAKIKQAKIKEEAKLSVGDLCERFLADYKGRRGREISPRTRKDYRHHIEGFVSQWAEHPAGELPFARVKAELAKMAKTKPVMANRLAATLSVLFGWAVDEGYVTANPIPPRFKPGGAERSKVRALDFDSRLEEVSRSGGEIRVFWNGLDDFNALHRLTLQMILLTAQRPGEVLQARWADFSDDHQLWIVPAENTKSKKRAHKVPVTPMFADLLEELKAYSGNNEFLFPDRFGKNSITPQTLASRLKKAQKNQGHPLHQLALFTAHDLRRTAATHLGDMGFMNEEVGLLLNHSSGGVTRIYNKSDGVKRIRLMLEAWHRRLDQILKGESIRNVVEIRR